MTRYGWMVLALCLGVAGLAVAAPAKIDKRMELSMLVTGQIHVDAGGRVESYSLDHREQLPQNVAQFLDANARGWEFEPTLFEGKAVAARNKMSLLLIAKPLEDGTFRITLRDANFYPLREAGYEIEVQDMTPPRYPEEAARAGATGTVYLVIKVAPDGSVDDVVAEQTNLGFAGSAAKMRTWRGVFERNAVARARGWKFRLPTQGDLAGSDEPWSVRVPVAYSLGRETGEKYGRWIVYMPGPRQRAPWVTEDDGVSPEALADGGVYRVGGEGGLRLASPLSSG